MSDVGRPTDYTEELVARSRVYLTSYYDMGDPIPTVAGLACVLGVTRTTLYKWAKDQDKAEFAYILEELAQRQERALVKGGLLGEYNAPITKMMLTKHGYSDRVDSDHTSSDGSMTPKDAAASILIGKLDAIARRTSGEPSES